MAVVGLTYVVGYLVAIQFIYRGLLRNQTANKARKGGRIGTEDVLASAAGASFLALGWFLAVPFLLTKAVIGRGPRRMSIEREIEHFEDEHAHSELVRRRLASARKAIEAEAREY